MPAFAVFVLLLLGGTLVPRHPGFRPTPDGVPIYVVSNGFHTDVVLPVREPRSGQDWLQRLGQPQWQAQFGQYDYVAFGWGNERFYLESYGGKLPKAGTVLRALLPGRTLMHVDFYRHGPQPGPRVVPLRISLAQYQQLSRYVEQSFAPDSAGHWQLRTAAGYSPEDFFFRARGRYHALRTCNDWTNQALGRSGIRAALKAPLAASVLYQVRRGAEK
ncbi:TIGR02117 family protein [Hymenobacter sp. 15J16-1T3B]|uniref:TIGR02117 family protein n=1 Tax=Hymenobacter sp. 15J16-1T3B TaxID=2886941 RepID=UPI001D1216E6|nr:TIGR02117 family protein [Hymenobacter sp. 15J16-1T3B]MCC3156772.1 TIGR02117 family protein [Hymenobacter sp. 15J16-1T3B]